MESRLAKLEEMLAPAEEALEEATEELTEEVKEEVKEELKEEVELSEEEVNFSPEAKDTNKGKLYFPRNSGLTTQERVFARMSNFNK